MKIAKLLIIFLMPFSMSGKASSRLETKFQYIEVKANYEDEISFLFNVKSGVIFEKKITINGYYADKNREIVSFSTKSNNYEKEYSFVNKIQNYTKLEFLLYLNSNLIETHTVNINKSYGLVNDLKNQTITTSPLGFIYTPTYGEKYISETFNFENVPQTLTIDRYQRIQFDNYRFSYNEYDGFKKLDIGEVYLVLPTAKIYFSKFKNENNIPQIELCFKKDEQKNNYYLSLKNKLYVNPTNLDMSPNKEEGYVETDHFYISDVIFKNCKNVPLNIVMLRVGLCQMNVLDNVRFAVETQLIGNCSNSRYCVKENTSEPNFELGKVVKYS